MPTLRGRLADFIRGAATTTTTKMKVPTPASIRITAVAEMAIQARSLPSHLIIWLPTALEQPVSSIRKPSRPDTVNTQNIMETREATPEGNTSNMET